jgi:hypothetical protein
LVATATLRRFKPGPATNSKVRPSALRLVNAKGPQPVVDLAGRRWPALGVIRALSIGVTGMDVANEATNREHTGTVRAGTPGQLTIIGHHVTAAPAAGPQGGDNSVIGAACAAVVDVEPATMGARRSTARPAVVEQMTARRSLQSLLKGTPAALGLIKHETPELGVLVEDIVTIKQQAPMMAAAAWH